MNSRIHSDAIRGDLRACPMLEMVEDGHDSRRFQMPCDSYSDRDHTQWRRHVSRGARMMIMVLAAGLCPCVPHVLHSREGIAQVSCGGQGEERAGICGDAVDWRFDQLCYARLQIRDVELIDWQGPWHATLWPRFPTSLSETTGKSWGSNDQSE